MTNKHPIIIFLDDAPSLINPHDIEIKVTNHLNALTNDALIEIRLLHKNGNTLAGYFTSAEVRMLIHGLIDAANHADAHDPQY